MDWYVGQRVICINDDWVMKITSFKETLPTKDVIYTIRDIIPLGDNVYLRLVEIKNAPDWYLNPHTGKLIYGEICFSEKKFKPLEENLDHIDISIFQEILDKIKTTEPAF